MSAPAAPSADFDPGALRQRFLAVAALTAVPFAVAILAAGPVLSLGPAHHAVAGGVFLAVILAAAGRIGLDHGHASLGLANEVTLLRAGLTALVAGATVDAALDGVSEPLAWWVALLAGAALLLDGADGWLARRQGLASAFGARFDMEVDALLILTLSAFAPLAGKTGWWMLGAGLLRYLFVAAAFVFPWMAAPLPPSFRRKLVCVVQAGTLVAIAAPSFPAPASAGLAAASLALLVWSFAVDTLWLARRRSEG